VRWPSFRQASQLRRRAQWHASVEEHRHPPAGNLTGPTANEIGGLPTQGGRQGCSTRARPAKERQSLCVSNQPRQPPSVSPNVCASVLPIVMLSLRTDQPNRGQLEVSAMSPLIGSDGISALAASACARLGPGAGAAPSGRLPDGSARDPAVRSRARRRAGGEVQRVHVCRGVLGSDRSGGALRSGSCVRGGRADLDYWSAQWLSEG